MGLLMVLVVVAMAAILVSLSRAITSDGYGVRPPPRSHHDIDEVDNRGMPTKYVSLR